MTCWGPGLVREAYADFVGEFEGMFHTGADGGAIEVISSEMEARELCSEFFECGKTCHMAEVVLRQRTRPDRDIRKDHLISNRKNGSDFAVDQRNQFRW